MHSPSSTSSEKTKGNLYITLGFLLSCLLLSLPSFAKSGWVSSGGELFRFDKNPWFVKNIKEVNYCVQFDQSSMTVSKPIAEKAIIQAIDFWKSEFSRASSPGQGFASLGTQKFTLSSNCSGLMDIIFKFGRGSLNEEESTFLDDPKKYIGVSVRTSNYDKVNMRASGFVYISSDIGPDSYHNTGNLIEKAWEKPNLLKFALIHELGHIFGIPHNGSGLMSEVFMDQLVHKRFSRHFINGELESYLHPPKSIRTCSLFGEFNAEFFGVSNLASCIQLDEIGRFKYKVSVVYKKDDLPQKIGEMRLVSTTMKDMAARPSTLIHLPEEQKVFTIEDSFLNTYMIGPVFTDVGGKGVYNKSGSLKPYHLYLEIKPESITLVGEVQGQPKPVFVYTQPLILKLQWPL